MVEVAAAAAATVQCGRCDDRNSLSSCLPLSLSTRRPRSLQQQHKKEEEEDDDDDDEQQKQQQQQQQQQQKAPVPGQPWNGRASWLGQHWLSLVLSGASQ